MTDPRYPVGRFQPPAEYTSALHAQWIEDIAAAPAALRKTAMAMTATELATPYREGGWTAAQVVHHLADSHIHAYVRIRLALTEDNPTIAPYSEARWATLPDAAAGDVNASLTLFEGLHKRLVALLRTLSPDDFRRTYVRSGPTEVSIERTLAIYAWHGRHHLAHIRSVLDKNPD